MDVCIDSGQNEVGLEFTLKLGSLPIQRMATTGTGLDNSGSRNPTVACFNVV